MSHSREPDLTWRGVSMAPPFSPFGLTSENLKAVVRPQSRKPQSIKKILEI